MASAYRGPARCGVPVLPQRIFRSTRARRYPSHMTGAEWAWPFARSYSYELQ
jgi:hypothetical protein